MNILDIIKAKKKLSVKLEDLSGLKAVLTHIEVAENYLTKAKNEDDTNLYTDIIYRTNHAFEGILKEAYAILTNKDSSKKTPFEIENYFADNAVLKSRVTDLFKNYRQEWRNPSTHDHQLFFTEQEAFLAIVNVSAFINILLDQMLEKISSDEESEEIKDKVSEIKSNIPDYKKLSLLDKCIELLIQFGKEFGDSERNTFQLREFQYLGLITGFIKSMDSSLEIDTEPMYKFGTAVVRPDIIISDGAERIIIEIKKSIKSTNIRAAESKLMSYLTLSKIKNGILFQIPLRENQEYTVNKIKGSDGKIDYEFAELLLM